MTLLEAVEWPAPSDNLEREPRSHRYTRAFDEDNPVLDSPDQLGGKGSGLNEMTRIGLPVPPGFTVTTGGWHEHKTNPNSEAIWVEIMDQMNHIARLTQKRFGDPTNPLFVSVRSGAKESMPGVLDSVLNVGITDATITALEQEIGQEAAYASYYALIEKIGVSRFGISQQDFDDIYQQYKDDTRKLVSEAKKLINSRHEDMQIFTNAEIQLQYAMQIVWDSWDSQEAMNYRTETHIPYAIGTAVNIEMMVWGNSLHDGAGSGVMYTRDMRFYGDKPVAMFAPHEQGTEVVSSSNESQPMPISSLPISAKNQQLLTTYADCLRGYYKQNQDIEFTIDGYGNLWMLQTRNLPLHALAKFRWLSEQMTRGLPMLSAQRRISISELTILLQPGLDPNSVDRAIQNDGLLCAGLGLCFGVATAEAASLKDAENNPQQSFILHDCLPKNQPYEMNRVPDNVVGIVFTNGGFGSHAVHSLRLTNKRNLPIILNADIATHKGKITIDGASGQIFKGEIPTTTNGPLPIGEQLLIKSWLRNPWLYTLSPKTDIFSIVSQVRQAEKDATYHGYDALKTIETIVFNALFPRDIRMDYQPISARDLHLQEKIIAKAREVFKNPSLELTIRTCHDPDLSAGGAWVRLKSMEELMEFLSNPDYPGSKYGGLPRFFTDNQQKGIIKAFLVGTNIPDGKMNMEQSIQYDHAAFTLSVTPSADIVLQIRPHSAHLRSFEEQKQENVVTVRARHNPHTKKIEILTRNIGDTLISDTQALEMAKIIEQTIFQEWWEQHEIPEKMAAIQCVFNRDSPPVLEGQFRLSKDSSHRWLSPMLYGIKTK